ncbi:MAG: hypothetical protein J6Z35_02625 [Lachnospiraceae bacterium]|nr:hypothetical protein [Lachnospiraceae bacterium]
MKNKSDRTSGHTNYPDDLEILDLENAQMPAEYPEGDDPESYDAEPEEEQDDSGRRDKRPRKGIRRFLNIHILFLVLVLAIVGLIFFRLTHWGQKIDLDDYFKTHEEITQGRDTFDVLCSLKDEDGRLIANKAPHTILFFGNNPLADDRDSENNLANIIARKSGSTVYNCSVGGSYLTSRSTFVKDNDTGLDVYNFYWLILSLVCRDNDDVNYFTWLRENPAATILPETDYVEQTLMTIDMNTVDTICIFYDGSDYLAGSSFNNGAKANDICSFTGNLEAGLDELQEKFPHIRIIVMSPTYAFGIDDNGEYISSDIKTYGDVHLSDYVIKECEIAAMRNVTFIDNLYGTFNEDEAPEYLTDNLHLNQAGREKVADRFIRALTYYDNIK